MGPPSSQLFRRPNSSRKSMGRCTTVRRYRRRVLHGCPAGSLVGSRMARMDRGSTRSHRSRSARVGGHSCCCYHSPGGRIVHMRSAKPNELRSHAYPVLTAAISSSELSNWFPVPFHYLTDPQETPEPSKAAVIKLDAGQYFVLSYGELSNQLMLRIPTSSDASAFLQAFFREVPLPRARIVWRRQDARLPRTVAAKTVSLSDDPHKRVRKIRTQSSAPPAPERNKK
jgi:hypothetical protein